MAKRSGGILRGTGGGRCADLVLQGLPKCFLTEDALLFEAQNLSGEVFWLGHGGRMSDINPNEGY